ncbi:MAG TPA: RES domain-containing protein, partial [Gaiellales bacterium]|nr:RES domain-containing protein [Gaiellales bacterium]
RSYGPLADMPFDPHPDGPPREHADVGVHYSAEDIATASAEMFQQDRLVNTTDGAPWLTSWTLRRPVRLLDLTGAWALRNGAAHALAYAPRPVCRTWVRAVYERFPDVEGVRSISTMTGGVNITLWARAADEIDIHPAFDRRLAEPARLHRARTCLRAHPLRHPLSRAKSRQARPSDSAATQLVVLC